MNERDLERVRAAIADDTFATHFELVAEAGRGGMGIVHRAIERETGRPLAIKLLVDTRDHERFSIEAAILERLSHPAIVTYVRHGVTSDGTPYLAMEWLEGESLSSRLARSGPLSVSDTVVIGARIASALAHAHAAHVLHRDLKPSNVILVGGDPTRATLIDFGVAKDTQATTLTKTGQIVGTPHYMAPEQALRNQPLDGRVDLFALGCLLYECLTGASPFTGDELIAVLAQILMHTPPPLSEAREGIPPRLDALVGSLLEKEPMYRANDATVVARELELIETALGANDRSVLDHVRADLRARMAKTLVAMPSPRRLRRWPFVVVPAVAILAVSVVLVSHRSSPATVEPCTGTAREACVARCKQNDRTSCLELGTQTAGTDREGLAYFVRACELGLAVGCTRGGARTHAIHQLDPASFLRTDWETLLQRGCDLGDRVGCMLLSTSLLKNQPRDPARAKTVLDRACTLGSVAACKQAAAVTP